MPIKNKGGEVFAPSPCPRIKPSTTMVPWTLWHLNHSGFGSSDQEGVSNAGTSAKGKMTEEVWESVDSNNSH